MTTYTDVFGGSSVQAADVQFRAVALSANIVTVWPAFATTGNQCARIMKVTPSAGSLTVTLPDATLTSAGMDVLFDNPSATTFTVLDAAGGTVATVAGGEVKYFYLSDSSTAAGTWRVTLFGVGASNVDAGQLAGYGLTALSSTLNIAAPVTQISSNTTVTTADRSKVFVWTGGSGTLTLPSTVGSTSNYAIEVHNQGTGTLTVATTGGVLVDGSATIALVVNESCFIHMGSTDWYTVGRGRNTQFNFTQLNKVVTGGTVNLTLTEASNVVQTFTGTLLSNQTVNQPAVVQVYYVSNSTSGAYTLTFGCVAGGTSVPVVQGQAAILFCDGTNIINANTSLAGGISSIVFGAGSASSPSASFSTSTTGFYSSGANEIGVTNNGVYTGKFTTGGYKAETIIAASLQAISSGAAASLVADRPAGSIGSTRWRTAGVDRWAFEATTTAEGGSNAGSNFALNAYTDAGALLGTALTVVRSTQVVTFTQPPALVGTSITGTAAGLTAGNVTTNANLTGDVTSTGNAATVIRINGTSLAGLATGILKNTTATGVPSIAAAGTDYVAPSGALGTPSSGTLTNCTADGTNLLGYRGIPQISQSAAYTLVLTDAGKHILHPSADTTARIFTIPANSSVAFAIGTAVTFVNQASGGVITIAITTDTMRLAGAGTTGSRTLAANGVATAIKLTSTEWIISGAGLT